MATNRLELRDWHRLFGLLLMDFFTGSPFVVEVERDLSSQQQLLDVIIVCRGQGEFNDHLPDGLDTLVTHNLFTFKSHHEALDSWAMKELIGHYVAYRKLVSPSPSEPLAESQFQLFAVCARSPRTLSQQVPWRQRSSGVYDCHWGTDVIRVIVAGELPREPRNAAFHLFSASPELIGFGSSAYQLRSENTSLLLGQLFGRLREEGAIMAFTMDDFRRQFIMEHFPDLTPQEQEKVLKGLPPEARLAGLPPEARLAGLTEQQIREYLRQLGTTRKPPARKSRRKK